MALTRPLRQKSQIRSLVEEKMSAVLTVMLKNEIGTLVQKTPKMQTKHNKKQDFYRNPALSLLERKLQKTDICLKSNSSTDQISLRNRPFSLPWIGSFLRDMPHPLLLPS